MNLPLESASKRSLDPLANLSPHQQRELLRQLLTAQADAAKRFGMSAGQQGLWYAFRRDPLSTAFNVFMPSRIVSRLDVDALQRALEFLVNRHPCLRTSFTDDDGVLRQRVNDSQPPEFTIVDASGFDDGELDRQVLAQTQLPFDLQTGPLMRMAVFRRSDHDHIVVATTHHIVVDFWSLILLLNELREVYGALAAGTTPSLSPAPGNYASFVAEQQAMLDGPIGQSLRTHWLQTLDGAPPVLNWFTDFQRPKAFSGRADVVPLRISGAVALAMKRIATEQATTTNAVVIAALQVFIARYTREDDFLIGSPFVGRGHRKYENTVGFFVNMLPLRADLTGAPSFGELVHRVGKTLLISLEHESLPLAEIVRCVQPPRDASRSPLFQVTCTFEKSHIREESGRAGFLMPGEQESADIGGMLQESFYVPHPTCHHDIEFIFEQTDTSLRGMICFCRDLFEKRSAETMAVNFANLIEKLVHSPEQSIAETPWPLSTTNTATLDDGEPLETLVGQLENAFQQYPDDVALVEHDRSITFKELDQITRKVASAIHNRGLGNGDMVPVAGRPGASVLIGLLGVIRSGATVIPIDVGHPAVNASDLIDDAAMELVVIDKPSAWSDSIATINHDIALVSIETLRQQGKPEDTSGEVGPSDLAYVIYTSGSTGRPKGVMIQQSAIANTIRWRAEHVAVSPTDRVLMLLSHQFDAGFGIMLSTLAQGAALVWPDNHSVFDLDATVDQIKRDRISVLPAIPSLLQLFANHSALQDCASLRQIWSGGESMPPDLPQRLRASSDARIWNFYGPTEAAVEAVAYEATFHHPNRVMPIGEPISNTNILVVDEAGHVVPDTVPGQLVIMGRGLALGYLNDRARTEKFFIGEPGCSASSSSRRYLTGDLGRRMADGKLEFLGRLDQQIKFRGYRIELEEIETVLRSHPAVHQAAAKLMHPDSTSPQLAAFIVPKIGATNHGLIESIQRYLADHLVAYKRPSLIRFVDQLPVGSSGKIIRSRLPDQIEADPQSMSIVMPSTKFEQHLANRWCEMLQIESVGINQNFFELGGSSLQAAMMTSKLTEDLGAHVPTSLLFDLADIAAMSRRLVDLHREVIEETFGTESVEYDADAAREHRNATQAEGIRGVDHPLIARLSPKRVVQRHDHDPIFMIHPPGGIVLCYRPLAQELEATRSLFAIRSHGLYGDEALPTTLQAMAAEYVDAILRTQPGGSYVVGGWSLGGVVAYEVAQQLLSRGDAVRQLILLDSTIPDGASDSDDSREASKVGHEYGIDLSLDELSKLDEDEQLPFLWQHAVSLGVITETSHHDVVQQVLRDLKNLFHHHVQLTSQYKIKPLAVPTLLVRPTDVPVEVKTSKDRGWGALISQVDVRFISGHHHSMVQPPHVSELAKVIEETLQARVDLSTVTP